MFLVATLFSSVTVRRRGTEEDTVKAIAAARSALEGWKTTPLRTRIDAVESFLARYEGRREEINDRLVLELGCTRAFATAVQSPSPIVHGKTLISLLKKKDGEDQGEKFEWERSAGKCTVVKEPVGVVGGITPWNYPINQIVLKVIPALLAGCTFVLKPSEVTPLVAYSVCEAIHESGCL